MILLRLDLNQTRWALSRSLWVFSPVPILLTLKGCLATDIGAEEEEEEEGRQLFAKLSWLGLRRLGEGRERECSNITAEEAAAARAARPKQESPRPNESCSGGRCYGGKRGDINLYKCYLPK